LLPFVLMLTRTTRCTTLSLHDALPISHPSGSGREPAPQQPGGDRGGSEVGGQAEHAHQRLPAFMALRVARPQRVRPRRLQAARRDRKSTRLNSSHVKISYAVFCLKKKK